LEGLSRLIENNFAFIISAKAKANLQEAMEDGNNIISLMQFAGLYQNKLGTIATTRSLYEAYHHIYLQKRLEKTIRKKGRLKKIMK